MARQTLTQKTKHIAIANKKGGVGKTALGILIMQELERRGYRCLIVDCDSQHNSSDFFNVDENLATVSEMMIDDYPCDELVQHTSVGDIVPASSDLGSVGYHMTEVGKSDIAQRWTQFQKMMNTVEGKYDFVFYDTNANYDQSDVMKESVLNHLDYIIIPFTCRDGVKVVHEFLDWVNRKTEDVNPSLCILGLVHNYYDGTLLHRFCDEVANEVIEMYHSSDPLIIKKYNFIARPNFVSESVLFNTRVRYTTSCGEALAQGENLVEHDSENRTAYDIAQLTDEILTAISNTKNGSDLVIKKAKRKGKK